MAESAYVSWVNPTPACKSATPYQVAVMRQSGASSYGKWVVHTSDVRMDFFWFYDEAEAFTLRHNQRMIG